jgi:hypothetical protein
MSYPGLLSSTLVHLNNLFHQRMFLKNRQFPHAIFNSLPKASENSVFPSASNNLLLFPRSVFRFHFHFCSSQNLNFKRFRFVLSVFIFSLFDQLAEILRNSAEKSALLSSVVTRIFRRKEGDESFEQIEIIDGHRFPAFISENLLSFGHFLFFLDTFSCNF